MFVTYINHINVFTNIGNGRVHVCV